MLIVAVVDSGQAFKACYQRFSYIPLTLKKGAPRLFSLGISTK
jgi:hypothetical protein